MKTNHKFAFSLLLLAAATFSSVQGASLNVIYKFTASGLGSNPTGALVQGSDGNFYGTTEFTTGLGLTGNDGTVFMITPAGVLTTLATFDGTNGALPMAAMIQGSDGNFYGTTEKGGSGNFGTAFKMTPAGVLTTLASFDGFNQAYPTSPLVQGSDGNFYGTSAAGGLANSGSVFMITPAGVVTTLFRFYLLGPTGAYPKAGLVQGSDGNFYGTASQGGNDAAGTVFEITPTGVFTTLFTFNLLGPNGADPEAGLVQGSDGNFYGAASDGGNVSGGTVFKMTPAGVLTTLATFNGTNGDGSFGDLVQGADGNFYGTTKWGSSANWGTVFRMTPAGALTTLAAFDNTNGANPVAGVVQGSDGNLYGVAPMGGSNDQGVIFQVVLTPPTLTFEAENLSYTSSGATTSVQTDSHSSGGKWVELAGNSTGDHIDFTIPNVPAGTYQLKMKWKGNDNRGILSLKVDGSTLGHTLDEYSADQTYPTTTFGKVTFSSPGNHIIRLTVTGKNKSSSNFRLSADKFTLVGQ